VSGDEDRAPEVIGFPQYLAAIAAAATCAAVAATAILGVAAGRGALAVVLFSPIILTVAMMFTLPHAILLALVSVVLRNHLRWWVLTAAGALVGIGPFSLLVWAGLRDSSTLPIEAFCAACGAVGGFAYWWQIAPPRIERAR
jgi:hypothetical protein